LKYLIGGGDSITRADKFAILKSSTNKSGVHADWAAEAEISRNSIIIIFGKEYLFCLLGDKGVDAQPYKSNSKYRYKLVID
jgi:hypothetical protein